MMPLCTIGVAAGARRCADGRCGRSARRASPSACARCPACREASAGSCRSSSRTLPLALVYAQLAVARAGDARGVVAAVFEPMQSLDQDRRRVALADIADDSAHDAALSAVDDSADLPLGVGRRAKAALAELASRAASKISSFDRALRLQRQVSPADEGLGCFAEEGRAPR